MSAAVTPDLSACEQEPIHIPGQIQPHGILLAVREPGLEIVQASQNADAIFCPGESVLGKQLLNLFPADQTASLNKALASVAGEGQPLYLAAVTAGSENQLFHAIAHRYDGLLIVELESGAADAFSFREVYPLVRGFIGTLQRLGTSADLTSSAAAEVRRLTNFDRVLIYRFDANWNGTVIAEDRNEELPSYLGLRFPASDIPGQARDLYRLNRLRLIPQADYTPIPISPTLNPLTSKPLDLRFSALRSVSPIHLEYMRNMGTGASMSISILRDGQLWGLISCHNKTPRMVPFEVRTACDFIGQVFGVQLAEKEYRAEYEYSIHLRSVQSRLLAHLAREPKLLDGMTAGSVELLESTGAAGAAVIFEDRCTLIGQTPDEAAVRRLADWLTESNQPEVFHTDSLTRAIPEASEYVERASGLLAVSISKLYRSYILWFRPEVLQTVKWSGDPRKSVELGEGEVRLHPRKSFETWKEIVRGQATPWRQSEIEIATELRNAVVGVVLRKAEELAQLSAELERSNQELESFSYSVSHDLRAPFRHIVGYAELLRELEGNYLGPEAAHYLNTIIESAHYAGTLVDELLNFSRIARTSLSPVAIDMNGLVREEMQELQDEIEGRVVRWTLHGLPIMIADPVLLRLAVRNLLANAVKYTRHCPEATIEIGCQDSTTETIIFVRDNGIGFEMQYVDKLFGVFQRLHRMEDFEGTGIGLANVRRIIGRHGGRTWAEGVPNEGATFYFSLPKKEPAPAT